MKLAFKPGKLCIIHTLFLYSHNVSDIQIVEPRLPIIWTCYCVSLFYACSQLTCVYFTIGCSSVPSIWCICDFILLSPSWTYSTVKFANNTHMCVCTTRKGRYLYLGHIIILMLRNPLRWPAVSMKLLSQTLSFHLSIHSLHRLTSCDSVNRFEFIFHL